MRFEKKAEKPPKPKQRALPAEVEFPKMLFKDNGGTMTVANVPGLESALKDGWKERAR